MSSPRLWTWACTASSTAAGGNHVLTSAKRAVAPPLPRPDRTRLPPFLLLPPPAPRRPRPRLRLPLRPAGGWRAGTQGGSPTRSALPGCRGAARRRALVPAISPPLRAGFGNVRAQRRGRRLPPARRRHVQGEVNRCPRAWPLLLPARPSRSPDRLTGLSAVRSRPGGAAAGKRRPLPFGPRRRRLRPWPGRGPCSGTRRRFGGARARRGEAGRGRSGRAAEGVRRCGGLQAGAPAREWASRFSFQIRALALVWGDAVAKTHSRQRMISSRSS